MFKCFARCKSKCNTEHKRQTKQVKYTKYISVDDLIDNLQRTLIIANGSYTSQLAFASKRHYLELLEKEKIDGTYIPQEITWWEEIELGDVYE